MFAKIKFRGVFSYCSVLSVFLGSIACQKTTNQSSLANAGFAPEAGSDIARKTVAISKKVSKVNCGENPVCLSRPVEYTTICTGSILSRNSIITAAHCILEGRTKKEVEEEILVPPLATDPASAEAQKPSSATRSSGSETQKPLIVEDPFEIYILFGSDSSKPVHVRKVTQMFRHKKYDISVLSKDRYSKPYFDIAVFEIEGAIPAEFEIMPLAKAESPISTEWRSTWLAGYGRQGSQHRVLNPSIKNKGNLGHSPLLNQAPFQVNTSRNLNAAQLIWGNSGGLCHGDSGGPLVAVAAGQGTNSPQIKYQIGIANWVDDAINCEGNSYFADVRKHLDYIDNYSRQSTVVQNPIPNYSVVYANGGISPE